MSFDLQGQFHLRRFAATDSLAELTSLLHRAYAELADMGLNFTATDQDEATTAARIAEGNCYVALLGGAMVGTITLVDTHRTKGCHWYDRQDVASLHQFGLLPEYQRRGLGSLMLAFVETEARRAGVIELALDTAEPARHLVGFYGRHGYRIVERVQWTDKTYRSVIMSKRLVAEEDGLNVPISNTAFTPGPWFGASP